MARVLTRARGRGMALRRLGGPLLACAVTVALPACAAAADAADAKDFMIDFDVSLMSDYIYRGVSLSQRRPSAATFIEARWYGFYASANVQNVDLPTSPVAEVTLTSGYRWERGDFKLDLNANYFWYPGEMLPEGTPPTSYAEYAVGIEQGFSQLPLPVTLKGLFAYSPNISGIGAWGAYVESGFAIDLPKLGDIEWSFKANAGYWRFGSISPELGGFPLPAYTNWRVGLEFDFNEHFTFDLSYWDTNLSKENCFVFTGDTMATPGGTPDPVTNPDGLRSRLCGATLVGTLTVKFDDIKLRR